MIYLSLTATPVWVGEAPLALWRAVRPVASPYETPGRAGRGCLRQPRWAALAPLAVLARWPEGPPAAGPLPGVTDGWGRSRPAWGPQPAQDARAGSRQG